jgi:hypothetical protein
MAWQGRLLEQRLGKKQPLEKVQTALGYPAATTEILIRLATMRRALKKIAKREGITYEEALKNDKHATEATAIARDYIDFGQGGSTIKGLDAAIPYLNAAVQGTRGIFKGAKRNPEGSLTKIGLLAAPAIGLYYAAKYAAPEALKDTPQEVRDKNWCIYPFGDMALTDPATGEKRYPYITIPKDPGQRFFCATYEALAKHIVGDPVDYESLERTLGELSPADVSSLPPTLSALVGYKRNIDLWAGDPYWRGPNIPDPTQEYWPGKTPEYAVDFGKALGLSPERMDGALKEIFTGGSTWTWMAGQVYNEVASNTPEDTREQMLATQIAQLPVVRRFLKFTRPGERYRDTYEEVKEEVAQDRLVRTRMVDFLSEQYLGGGDVERKEIFRYIKTAKDKHERERLFNRYEFHLRVSKTKNRRFWLDLHYLSTPEARAKFFYEEWNKMSAEEGRSIRSEMGKVEGIFTDRFIEELTKLRMANRPVTRLHIPPSPP